MKKIFFNVTACICAGLLFAGCNKEGDDDVNSSGGSSFNGVIEATAVSLSPGLTADEVDIDRVKVVVRNRENGVDEDIASSGYNNGRFILNLPLIVQDKYLRPVTDGLSGNVKVSNVNAKLLDVNHISAYKGENEVGVLNYRKDAYDSDNEIVDSEVMSFMYVDRDVNVTGSSSEIDDDVTWTYNFNLSLKKGWNKYYMKVTKKSSNTISMEYTNKELSGLTWRLTSYWGN